MPGEETVLPKPDRTPPANPATTHTRSDEVSASETSRFVKCRHASREILRSLFEAVNRPGFGFHFGDFSRESTTWRLSTADRSAYVNAAGFVGFGSATAAWNSLPQLKTEFEKVLGGRELPAELFEQIIHFVQKVLRVPSGPHVLVITGLSVCVNAYQEHRPRVAVAKKRWVKEPTKNPDDAGKDAARFMRLFAANARELIPDGPNVGEVFGIKTVEGPKDELVSFSTTTSRAFRGKGVEEPKRETLEWVHAIGFELWTPAKDPAQLRKRAKYQAVMLDEGQTEAVVLRFSPSGPVELTEISAEKASEITSGLADWFERLMSIDAVLKNVLDSKPKKHQDRPVIDEIPAVEVPPISQGEVALYLHALANHFSHQPADSLIQPGELIEQLPLTLQTALGRIIKLSGRDVSTFAVLGEAAKVASVDPTAVSYAVKTGRLPTSTLAGNRKVVSIFDVHRLWPNGGHGRPGRPRKNAGSAS